MDLMAAILPVLAGTEAEVNTAYFRGAERVIDIVVARVGGFGVVLVDLEVDEEGL